MPVHDRRPRVVIADDHPSVLDAFVRLLQRGCDVVARVPNGLEAVDVVTELKPDVLVVDLMMPDLDGVEVCRRVKQAAPQTDVIIVTAFDDSDVQHIAVDNGAAAYVAKHSAASNLQPTIDALFSKKQADRQRLP